MARCNLLYLDRPPEVGGTQEFSRVPCVGEFICGEDLLPFVVHKVCHALEGGVKGDLAAVLWLKSAELPELTDEALV